MKYLKLFVLFVITFNLSFLEAQEKLENSVLWKVSKPELQQDSYIFASLHFMCADDFFVPEKVTQALTSVDALVLEVNLSDPKEMQAMQASFASSEKISKALSKEQYLELDKLVTKVTGNSLEIYDSYGLSMLQSIMIGKMLPCAALKSFENELSIEATQLNKPILSLETAQEQIEILNDSYPPDFAFEQLMLFESYKKDFNKAIEVYRNEDINTAVRLLNADKYMDENATYIMQIERNKKWVETMPAMMKSSSKLFAVGAAHLTNTSGIINLLREKGYSVVPVTD
ncbi:TraB/GumN family protein [Leeuwenhoekiella sp. A16]|uniref:TraB/GumN family protein n=1 Tax=Leeuwenhoekiella sp. A16 TaxID=3141462 RepID=UPI003A80D263